MIFWQSIASSFTAKLLLMLSLVGTLPTANAESLRFALIGDTPYSDHERTELPKMLAAIANRHVEFIAHVGDFKSGSSRCDDAVFEDRLKIFEASRVPFLFVPGDNEWTDCDRLSNGSYDPLERLNKLRQLFWHDEFSLGQKKLRLERQPGTFPEHSRFRLGTILFVTLNLPGGNNNRGLTDQVRPEFLARNPMLLSWLRDSFKLANREQLSGVVLLFQANPGFSHFAQGLPHSGYREFLTLLQEESHHFSGRVVVVHGDTHISRIDQPLRDINGRTNFRFTRVETHGYPFMGWTLGVMDTENPALVRFETHPWPDSEK